DAKNYFDQADKPIPDFYRHQVGAVLGGPVVKDKTFYFASFESLIERLGVTGVTAVPDDSARRGVLPAGAVTLHPAIPQYLDTLFPRANGRSLGGGAAEYLFTQNQPTNEYFAQLRIDHRFKGGNSLFARYTFDDGKVDRVPPNKPPISITKEHSRNQYLTVEDQHVFSSALLNTLKGGINRSVSEADNVRTVDIPPSLAWLPGERFGYFTITGLVTEMAGDFRLPRNLGLRYEFITTPTEVNGKLSNLRSVTDASLTVGEPWHSNPSLKNIAPRLGINWDPSGKGSTSVRAGFGIFYDEILPKYYFFSGSLNPPFTTRTTIVNPPFPYVNANFDPNAPIRAQLQTVNYDLQSPFITQ